MLTRCKNGRDYLCLLHPVHTGQTEFWEVEIKVLIGDGVADTVVVLYACRFNAS